MSDATELNGTTVRDVRLNELVRVTTGEVEVQRGEIIAKWPYTQKDLKDETHVSDVHTRRGARKDMTRDNPVWLPDVRHTWNGHRVTVATPDGGRYAVVDWAKTSDPPYVYMLVIDGDEPEDRRWTQVGNVQSIQRYGPQPHYQMNGMTWGFSREIQVEALELAATGELETEWNYGLGDRADELRELADIRREDSPQPLSRGQVYLLAAASEATRDHVLNTGTPIHGDSVSEDADALRNRPAFGYYKAKFPDGDGGWISSERNPGGMPGDDIPPWEQEQRADPDFTPLAGGDGGGE